MSLVALKQPYMLQVMYDTEPLNPREEYDNLGHMMCWHKRYNLGDENRFKDSNAFLQNLVKRTASEYAIIGYARFGRSDTIRLSYDRAAHGGTVESYNHYDQHWYQEDYFEGNLEDNKKAVAESLVESMDDNDLFRIASVKNVILPLYLFDHSGLRMSAGSFARIAPYAEWDSGQVGSMLRLRKSVRSMAVCRRRMWKRPERRCSPKYGTTTTICPVSVTVTGCTRTGKRQTVAGDFWGVSGMFCKILRGKSCRRATGIWWKRCRNCLT